MRRVICEERGTPDDSLHELVGCDGCRKKPIASKPPYRYYRCRYCKNVDLCEDCFAKRSKIHPKDHQFFSVEQGLSEEEQDKKKCTIA
jgi:hypothetical protein